MSHLEYQLIIPSKNKMDYELTGDGVIIEDAFFEWAYIERSGEEIRVGSESLREALDNGKGDISEWAKQIDTLIYAYVPDELITKGDKSLIKQELSRLQHQRYD